MKVFISWSGDISREVAETLHKFLPCMIQGLHVFMSKHDIESGGRWSLQLAKELDESGFGIICLTPDNLQSPWLLFEAGALTKHVEGRACGLLLNGLKPTDVTGPLSQFQNRPFEKNEFRLLLRDINSRVSNPLSDQQLDMVFEKWWPDIKQGYEEALKNVVSSPKVGVQRDQKDILEEILIKVRGVERRLEMSPYLSTQPSLSSILERTVDDLSETQQDLLAKLAVATLEGLTLDKESIERDYSQQDLRQLVQTGLVMESEQGPIIVHDVVADYLRQLLRRRSKPSLR